MATFASLISRIQQVVNAAVKHGRKVTVVGRSMSNNVKMALNMGYLEAPQGTIVSMNETRQLPHDQVVIVATGSQGEPTSALVRIANGEHQDVEIVPGDTIVISASPIPGNEKVVSKTINNLYRKGANVLYSRIALVHVHGHASQEELKMMLSLIKPRFFVPVHGEYRHLVAHSALAQSMGIPAQRAFVLEDGDVLELDESEGHLAGKVPAGHVFVDGNTLINMHSSVINERRRLAKDGIVAVMITLSRASGNPLEDPGFVSSGFVELEDSQELFEKTSKVVLRTLDLEAGATLDLKDVQARVSESVSKYLYDETRRRPTVVTVVQQV